MARFELALDAAARRVRVAGARVSIPVRYEIHWRRFQTIATELLRDAAFEASRVNQPELDEADRVVFAEVFVRDRLLSGD